MLFKLFLVFEYQSWKLRHISLILCTRTHSLYPRWHFSNNFCFLSVFIWIICRFLSIYENSWMSNSLLFLSNDVVIKCFFRIKNFGIEFTLRNNFLIFFIRILLLISFLKLNFLRLIQNMLMKQRTVFPGFKFGIYILMFYRRNVRLLPWPENFAYLLTSVWNSFSFYLV